MLNDTQVQFDVFLCHNSKEKEAVERIREELKARGIYAWLDKYDFEPFRRWQDQLEEIIPQVRAVAIFLGSSGVGPWVDIEMREFLVEFANRKIRMGLVILPGCPEELIDKVPRFMKGFHWVDFRQHVPEPIDQLIWGITGQKSKQRLKTSSIDKDDIMQESKERNKLGEDMDFVEKAVDTKTVNTEAVNTEVFDTHSTNTNTSKSSIELHIDGDFNNFSEIEQKAILHAIETILKLKQGEVVVRRIRSGSIRMTIELPSDKVEELLQAIKDGKLEKQGILDARRIKLSSGEYVASLDGLNISSEGGERQVIPLGPIRTVIRREDKIILIRKVRKVEEIDLGLNKAFSHHTISADMEKSNEGDRDE